MKIFSKLSFVFALLLGLNLTNTYCMEDMGTQANITTYRNVEFKFDNFTIDLEIKSTDSIKDVINQISAIFAIPFNYVAILSGGERIDNNLNLNNRFLDPNLIGNLDIINSFKVVNSLRR